MIAFAVVISLLVSVVMCVPYYHHQFAVHVSEGKDIADGVAHQHGFINHGQIGSLRGYYLFSHPHVSKRSPTASFSYLNKLKNDPQVRWAMQQTEIKRTKRDQSWQPEPSSELANLPSFPDPLFKDQWYLVDRAGNGLDMSVADAWRQGFTGKGVVVSVLDDGIQHDHPDLRKNYDPAASTDINGNDTDPMPQDNGDNKHGTRCAGEIAAVAFNSYCGVGIAYNANIGGIRMLDGLVNDAVEAQALGFNQHHIDIYSASWGPEDDGKTVDGPGPLARRAFINGITSGRGGKGSIFIWASGNGGKHKDSCNCDGYANSIFTISISSATQGGYKPWYLEECSSTLASTYSSGTPGRDKSIVTVDMDIKLRPEHICTEDHTGTSASAPLAAGISALVLEANPFLTWRDMQHLLVMTSKSKPLEKEQGWMLNGAKRKFSHKFGYGLMNAAKMVTLAKQWLNVPPQHICKSQKNQEDMSIDTSSGFSLSLYMDVTACNGTMNDVKFLEHVQCKISLSFFPRGNLRILLTSPMGTTSTLLLERPNDNSSSNFDDWPFLSVHFWGEKAEGRWSLQILNAGKIQATQAGILKNWQLVFYGTEIDPIRFKKKYNFNLMSKSDPNLYDLTKMYGNIELSNLFNEIDINVSDRHKNSNSASATFSNQLFENLNNKIIYKTCDQECDIQGCYGMGPTQCIACKHYQLDNTCLSKCPPRSFVNLAGICWPCHETCETCAGDGPDNCLTCAPAHLLVVDLAVCIQQCPEGYYLDSKTSTCNPCAEHCDSCSEQANICTSCSHKFVLYKGSCLSSCPPGTYQDDGSRCISCHETCESCLGPGDYSCVSCYLGSFYQNGSCTKSCPMGFFADIQRKECVSCPVGCSICSNDVCTICKTKWILSSTGICEPKYNEKCDSNKFYEDNNCKICHSNCESCSGTNEWECVSCKSLLLLQETRCVLDCTRGYYQAAGRCLKCPHTCDSCVSLLNCTSCTGSLRLQSGTCRTTCAPGYYPDGSTCSKCYLSCGTCTGPRRDQCGSCPRGWQLAGGECRPECPEGYFLEHGACRRCHRTCRSCTGAGPHRCSECAARAVLVHGACVWCARAQYYSVRRRGCAPCHETCATCEAAGPAACTACAAPLGLDAMNHKCLPCCSKKFTMTNVTERRTSDCCHCDKDIVGCINNPSAGKRRIADGKRTSTLELVAVEKDTLPSSMSQNYLILVTAASMTIVLLSIALAIEKIKTRKNRLSVFSNKKYTQLKTFDEENYPLTPQPTVLDT